MNTGVQPELTLPSPDCRNHLLPATDSTASSRIPWGRHVALGLPPPPLYRVPSPTGSHSVLITRMIQALFTVQRRNRGSGLPLIKFHVTQVSTREFQHLMSQFAFRLLTVLCISK